MMPKLPLSERGYKITGNDITSKNEQLESARNQWHTQIDEEALSLLGIFPGNWHVNLKYDVKKFIKYQSPFEQNASSSSTRKQKSVI